ncbi:MAG: FAD-dependent oxidoreductase [Dehalococcoidia bacterium]|nr:FAD-dependent oxidoreductase [Dehalococcoidia bacterium]
MKILILGYGPAAISALRAISEHKKSQSKTRVTIVAPENHAPYSPMFLVELGLGDITRRRLSLPTPSDTIPYTVISGHKVTGIHAKNKTVLLDNDEKLTYDRLLIATGASAVKPPVKGIQKSRVLTINRLSDTYRLRHHLGPASNILVVGAGAIGIESALAFAGRGKKVTVIEALKQILPLMLDGDMAEYVQRNIEKKGISFCLDSPVSEITGQRRAEGVVVNERHVEGDLVIISTGFRPNTGFLKSPDIGIQRGILVNERMETSFKGIYAAGDVVETRNPFSDRYELNFTWYSAVEQGWTAGCNIMGMDKKCLYSPSLNVMKGLDFTVASIGQKVQEGNSEILAFRNEKAGVLEKIYLNNNFIEHYQVIGVPDKVGYLYNLIKNRKNVAHIKNYLLENKFSPIYLVG